LEKKKKCSLARKAAKGHVFQEAFGSGETPQEGKAFPLRKGGVFPSSRKKPSRIREEKEREAAVSLPQAKKSYDLDRKEGAFPRRQA